VSRRPRSLVFEKATFVETVGPSARNRKLGPPTVVCLNLQCDLGEWTSDTGEVVDRRFYCSLRQQQLTLSHGKSPIESGDGRVVGRVMGPKTTELTREVSPGHVTHLITVQLEQFRDDCRIISSFSPYFARRLFIKIRYSMISALFIIPTRLAAEWRQVSKNYTFSDRNDSTCDVGRAN
jgi:hypothetical protein